MSEIEDLTSKLYTCVQVKLKNAIYDQFKVIESNVNKAFVKNERNVNRTVTNMCGDCAVERSKIVTVYIDPILAHYVVEELKRSNIYRNGFIRRFGCGNVVLFKLTPAKKEIIDYIGNKRLSLMIWEKLECDNALSWLSTLGGAFSSLGDYIPNCARIAGQISYDQLTLAMRLGDPNIVSRCQLYFSLSLIQRGYFKRAKWIIAHEYHYAIRTNPKDNRLVNMCLGIWAKLKYEMRIKKKSRFICMKICC